MVERDWEWLCEHVGVSGLGDSDADLPPSFWDRLVDCFALTLQEKWIVKTMNQYVVTRAPDAIVGSNSQGSDPATYVQHHADHDCYNIR